MAALVAGNQYGLSSSSNFSENKELIFVKLTDSAFRAIEEHLKNKNKSTQTPTIQFLGKDGHLSFPTCRGEQARFNFSISSNQEQGGIQGSFECVQQSASSRLESLGGVHCRMRILAKDDVYEATRHRMAAAEQQQKQNCTREIELDKAGMGRKYKKCRPSASIPPRNNGAAREPYSSAHAAHAHTPAAPSHTKPQGNNHAQKPGNPDIMRRSIRDRLIHLLAVRPYKKPELYSVINREGIRDREKTQVMAVLGQVATVRDNTYHLMRHIWNDVQEDWPFYTEQDRQMLKRRKPQNLTPPGSSDSGSSVSSGRSPSSVAPGSPPEGPPPAYKRPPSGYSNDASGLPTKKPRIAHCRKTEEVFRRSDSGSGRPSPLQYPTSTTGGGYGSLPRLDEAPARPAAPRRVPTPTPAPSPQQVPPDSTTRSPEKESEQAALGATHSRPLPKFLQDYTTITSLEQRRKYKEDFNSNYEEYRKLHTIVAKVSGKFAQLEQRLNREKKDSDEYKKIKNQILLEYEESKKDKQQHDARKRFQYLHEKLSHIKKLVLEYDTTQLAS